MTQALDPTAVTRKAKTATGAPVRKLHHDWLLISVLLALSAGAWYVGKLELYTSDSELGYNLGLVGGSAMLLLLLYPVRKRVRLLRSVFPLKYWFGAHMFLGILGPMLIIYHSNFRLASVNGSVSFYSMMAVFISGLMGRFIYRRIHYGLYGRKATLEELKGKLGMNEESVHSRFHKLPEVEQRLEAFEERMLNPKGNAIGKLLRVMTARFRASWVRFRTVRVLKKTIRKAGKRKNWAARDTRRRIRLGSELIDHYLESVTRIAQFGLYERLFSLWHIAHVPLIFLLLVTAVIHVLAVHMY